MDKNGFHRQLKWIWLDGILVDFKIKEMNTTVAVLLGSFGPIVLPAILDLL